MARDRQIFVRTTQEAYDWVAAQAEALGESQGAVVSAVLENMARSGAVLERPSITLAAQRAADPVSAVRQRTGTRQPPAAKPEPPPAPPQEPAVPPVLPEQERRCTHAGKRQVGGWCKDCDHFVKPGGSWA